MFPDPGRAPSTPIHRRSPGPASKPCASGAGAASAASRSRAKAGARPGRGLGACLVACLVAVALPGAAATPNAALWPEATAWRAAGEDTQPSQQNHGPIAPPLDPVFRAQIRAAALALPGLALQRARISATEAGVDAAWAAWRPRIDLGSQRRQAFENASRLGFDVGSRTDVFLTASQRLWDFGATNATIRAARRRKKGTTAAGRGEVARLVVDLVAAHLDVVRLRAEAAATAHHARRARGLQDRAQARASAGAGGAVDVSRAASQLAELEARRIAIAGERRRAEAVYQELFRTTPAAGLALPFPLAAAAPALDATVTAALADNPRLAGAEAEAAALAEDATAAERSRLPALTLRLQGRRFDVTGNPFEANGAASDDLAVTVEAAYPLYAGGSAGARAREARARAQEAELAREVLRRELVRTARSAHAALLARRDELHAVSALVDAEAATVAAFEDQYRIGRRQLTDLFLAERDLLASTLRLVRMRTELDMARIELLAVTGRLREHFGLHDSLVAEAPR